MANKFIVWCENEDNTQDYESFALDSQRQNGFVGGTPASAIRVNTALRQANLVSAALMNALMPDNQTLDYRNNVDTVANAINTSLNQRIKTTVVDNATNADNVVITSTNQHLPLTISNTNKLEVDDTIISRKKLMWSGSFENDSLSLTTMRLPFEINEGDIYEIHLSLPLTGYEHCITRLVVENTISSQLEGHCHVSGIAFTVVNDSTNGYWLFDTRIGFLSIANIKNIHLHACTGTLVNSKTMNPVSSELAEVAFATTITAIYKIIE